MVSDNIQKKINRSLYSQQMENAAQMGRHSVHMKQKERQLRKKRKRLSRLKTYMRFLLFLCLSYLIYLFVTLPGWYLNSDVFSRPDGETVEIINNKLIPTNFLYNALKEVSVSHVPIFIMPVTSIKHELYKIPAIKTVYVRRYGFPARIKIIVREKVPMAVIKSDLNQLPVAFATTDNVIVTNKNFMHLAQSDSTLVILTKNPEFRKDWTIKKIQYIDKIAKTVEIYSKEKVEYVDARDPNDIYIKIKSTNIRVGVLDSSVFERIKRIETILPQLNKIDEKIKYVDLSWDKVNYLKIQKEEANVENTKETTEKNDI